MNTRLNVLVLGAGRNITSIGILKALALSDLKPRVIGACISPIGLGLYTTDRAYLSPRADEANFKEWVFDICRKETVNVLLTGVEEVLDQLAGFKEELFKETGAISIVSDSTSLHISNDKLRTCQWLAQNRLAYPLYATPDDNQALEALIDKVGFPLIAKPRVSKGSVGLLTIRSKNDLDLIKGRTDYIIQEYLGDASSEYTVGCVCDRQGIPRGAIVMHRELYQGATYRAVVGEFPEVRAEALNIAAAMKPLGPCNTQIRLTPRGPVCFEINLRFSGTTPMRARLGFNDVEWTLRHFVLGEPAADLPMVSSGIALRYWNEMYLNPAAYQTLCEQGWIDPQWPGSATIEDYGIQH